MRQQALAGDPAYLASSAGHHRVAYRALRALAVAAVGFVLLAAFQASPAPGGHGAALGVTIALAAFCTATAVAMWRAESKPPSLQLAVLLVAVAAVAALIALQANSAGFLGVFPAVSVAALMLPTRLSTVVLTATVAAVATAWPWNGSVPVVGMVLNEFGIVAVYLLSLLARRLRESNERTESLLAELEQTRAAQAQAAALAERQRLAREMHDVLAHTMSGLVLNLEAAGLLADRTDADPRIRDAVGRARRLARTGLGEARQAIGMLRGDALPGPGELAGLAAEFEADSGVGCSVAVSGSRRELNADAAVTVYRVAQEALTNIRKHAPADRVEISLAYQDSGTRLTVADFGPPSLPQPGSPATDSRAAPGEGTGYGLTGMRERAALLGGTLTAGPSGGGFRVELWIPA